MKISTLVYRAKEYHKALVNEALKKEQEPEDELIKIENESARIFPPYNFPFEFPSIEQLQRSLKTIQDNYRFSGKCQYQYIQTRKHTPTKLYITLTCAFNGCRAMIKAVVEKECQIYMRIPQHRHELVPEEPQWVETNANEEFGLKKGVRTEVGGLKPKAPSKKIQYEVNIKTISACIERNNPSIKLWVTTDQSLCFTHPQWLQSKPSKVYPHTIHRFIPKLDLHLFTSHSQSMHPYPIAFALTPVSTLFDNVKTDQFDFERFLREIDMFPAPSMGSNAPQFYEEAYAQIRKIKTQPMRRVLRLIEVTFELIKSMNYTSQPNLNLHVERLFKDERLKELRESISQRVLNEFMMQYARKSECKECDEQCNKVKKLGIPCTHMVQDCSKSFLPLFSSEWIIKKPYRKE